MNAQSMLRGTSSEWRATTKQMNAVENAQKSFGVGSNDGYAAAVNTLVCPQVAEVGRRFAAHSGRRRV